jgi:hypothetical protein
MSQGSTQPVCPGCGAALSTGFIKGTDGVQRFGVLPCPKCNKICPSCGGSGIAPDPGKPAETPPA